MILLDVEGIRKHFGPEPVLDGVTFQVRPGERIALVGPNGSGKTTLMRILAKQVEADAGTCRSHLSVHLGYLEQQPNFDSNRSLWDEAASALAGLKALEEEAVAVAEAMAASDDTTEQQRLAGRYDHLQQELHRQDAYNLDYRIKRVLDGLGFAEAAFSQPVVSLSGGEQNRVILAKLLLAEPNVMLLDEPSNHLDIEATEWLENFLVESSAALLVVSHDRCFLDKVTNRTLELFRGTVDSFTGNFSAYWRQKEERLLVQRRTYEKQQIEIEKTKDFIRRHNYGQKHAQAEDRRKKLERIELVEPPREIEAPPMAFAEARRSGDIVLRAEGLAKSYEQPLFADVDLQITRGERWAVLGPNGCGKTTLLKCLLGLLKPDAGGATLGTGVELGYFDQHLAELDDDTAVVDAIHPEGKEFLTQQRRDLLARFGVTGDTALQAVGQLSGGERCRAALARLAAADANFLVLDEPTNHLDLWARDALEEALNRFVGTVLFVSHDRFFVNRVATHLLVVEPGHVQVIEGNYESYQRRKAPGPVPTNPSKAASPKPAPSLPGNNKPEASKNDDKPVKRKRRFPYRKVADLEDEIFQRETRVEDLQAKLIQGETHRNGDLVRQINCEISEQQAALATLYEHWEEATELNW